MQCDADWWHFFLLTERAEAQVSAELSGEDQVTQINANWNAHYQQLKSVEFDLTVTKMVAKGYYSSMEHLMHSRGNEQKEDDAPVYPVQDSEIQEQMKVAIDGERILIESSGEVWHASRKKFIHMTSRTSFDGQVTKTYRHNPRPEKGIFQKQGFIGDGKHDSDFDLVYFLPLKFWLGPMIGQTPLVSKVIEATTEQGRPLTIAFDEQDHAKLWLDPARQFAVTRLQYRRGVLGSDIEVTSSKIDQTWIPTTWQFVETQDRGRVVTCELSNVKLNPKIDPTVFDIEFPPETAIQDLRQPKKTTMYRHEKTFMVGTYPLVPRSWLYCFEPGWCGGKLVQ